MGIFLDRLANIATVVLCGTVVYLAFARYRASDRNTGGSEGLTPYAVGDVLPKLGSLGYDSSERTLIAVVRADCPFCVNSVPLYQRVIARRDASRTPLKVILVLPESDRSSDFAKQHGLHPDTTVRIGKGVLKVQRTPTLFIVDREGRLLRQWEGQLRDEREAELVGFLFSEASPSARTEGATAHAIP